jgi:hypothetical protein
MSEIVSEVAFAIYSTWSRERDPDRQRRRFDKLPQPVREEFEAEAKAAIRVIENIRSYA